MFFCNNIVFLFWLFWRDNLCLPPLIRKFGKMICFSNMCLDLCFLAAYYIKRNQVTFVYFNFLECKMEFCILFYSLIFDFWNYRELLTMMLLFFIERKFRVQSEGRLREDHGTLSVLNQSSCFLWRRKLK